jgi:hypothetical protein
MRSAQERSAATPEFQTLLACARMRLDPGVAASIGAAVRTRFNHQRFLSLTLEHAVAPLVYRSLKATCWDELPAPFRSELAGYAAANAGRSRFLTAELLGVLRAFEGAGIRAVPFKGPALAASAYGDVALREYTDLDIIVRQGDLAAAGRILEERAYRPRETGDYVRSPEFLRNECQLHYWGLRDSTLVELHWRLAQRYFDFPFPLESRWDGLAETEIEGRRLLAFQPEDQLLFLCVHGARHLWSSLNWVCDVAEQIRAFANLDWQFTFYQAAQTGNERTLILGLALAQRLLGARTPGWARSRVESCAGFDAVIAGIVERLETLAEPGILQIARFHMARQSGIYRKMRQCALLLACPSVGDWEAGPARLPLLALRRPLRLLWKYKPRKENLCTSVASSVSS